MTLPSKEGGYEGDSATQSGPAISSVGRQRSDKFIALSTDLFLASEVGPPESEVFVKSNFS